MMTHSSNPAPRVWLARIALTAPQVLQASEVPQPSGALSWSLARSQATASPGRAPMKLSTEGTSANSRKRGLANTICRWAFRMTTISWTQSNSFETNE